MRYKNDCKQNIIWIGEEYNSTTYLYMYFHSSWVHSLLHSHIDGCGESNHKKIPINYYKTFLSLTLFKLGFLVHDINVFSQIFHHAYSRWEEMQVKKSLFIQILTVMKEKQWSTVDVCKLVLGQLPTRTKKKPNYYPPGPQSLGLFPIRTTPHQTTIN